MQVSKQRSCKGRAFLLCLGTALAGQALTGAAWARDLKITIPRRSELTPVQRLNRGGVAAIERRQYEKAESLFYKAYLYDPTDPFTLNNLGYVSELQGQLERAQRFYELASEQGSEATIDKSNARQLEGKPMTYAIKDLRDVPMRVNRMNIDAMGLIAQDRAPEAASLLRHALALDPQNPFTLNNLGVAVEATGDYEQALRYYNAAAAERSSEPIVVTLKESWRGKPVSQMAEESAQRLSKRIRQMEGGEERAMLLTLQAVAAANSNDWPRARQNFLDAYQADPQSAFSLNNRGYVAERDGDLETARYFYRKAREAADAEARVGIATQRAAEGKQVGAVARVSTEKVTGAITQMHQERRQETGPIELKRRDGTPIDPQAPMGTESHPAPSNTQQDSSSPSPSALQSGTQQAPPSKPQPR